MYKLTPIKKMEQGTVEQPLRDDVVNSGPDLNFVIQTGDCSQEWQAVMGSSPRLLRPNSASSIGVATTPPCENAVTNLRSDKSDRYTTLSKYESMPKPHQRRNRRIGRLNTQLLEAVESCDVPKVKKLLEAGANPNATCHVDSVSACHIAALTGDGALSLLVQYGAEKRRIDRMGRTPLHIAAWAGHVRHLGLILELPYEIQKKIDNGEVIGVEEDLKKLNVNLEDVVNIRCGFGEQGLNVPNDWQESIDHDCNKTSERLPFFQPAWTPLHAASSTARHHCVNILLAVGAKPNLRDIICRSPLDVAGSACYFQTGHQSELADPAGFSDVVTMLLAAGCSPNTTGKRTNLHTPLHTAVELGSLEGITVLLKAGACPTDLNRDGLTPPHVCVKKRLKPHLQAFFFPESEHPQCPTTSIINVRDKDGCTVLHSSVLNSWLPGVCLALEAGAEIITWSNKGDTPLHTAAMLGQPEILKELLEIDGQFNAVDIPNNAGETALFNAIVKGNIECVKILLKHGALVTTTCAAGRNVLHVAAIAGSYDMLKLLLDYDYTITREIVNHLDLKKGYGPIHYAVEKNHVECVKLLLSKNAFIMLAASNVGNGHTPLHIAAKTNNVELVKLILKNGKNILTDEVDKSLIDAKDALGCNALHTACSFASRDVIKLLLSEGFDLSAYTVGEGKCRITAIQLIMNNLSKPTEFLREIFDSYINCNKNCQQHPSCIVTVDYRILVPNKQDNSETTNNMELRVIEALLKTGNTNGQKRLLIHPLVDSFLCIKWDSLLLFFYTMLVLYGCFAIALSLFVISTYFYRDSSGCDINYEVNRPHWLNHSIWVNVLYITISLIVLLEILCMNLSRRYFIQLDTWVKFFSIALAIVLPHHIVTPRDNWPRHIATIAVLLSWLQMTFLISRFPKWGYFVLMFRKVSIKVLKILLTFVFLVIGFALSFMIEYRSKTPFENPWAALIKVMVMMTSEFDYDDLVNKFEYKESLDVIRLLFLIFLILASIVLMNLMVAVAVNDLNDLEVLGNIVRLEKQVEFLSSLETLVNVKMFMKILPQRLKDKLEFARSLKKITLRPFEPKWSLAKAIPPHVRDTIIDKALTKKEDIEDKLVCDHLHKKLDDILEAVATSNMTPVAKSDPLKRSNGNYLASKYDLDEVKQQIDDMKMKLDTMLHYLINNPKSK